MASSLLLHGTGHIARQLGSGINRPVDAAEL
jgi:hypothetical protein